MANKKISEFEEALGILDNAFIPIIQGNPIDDYKISKDTLINEISKEIPGGNYDLSTNKPKINNVELSGNKTSDDLGLQPAGDYVESVTSTDNHIQVDNTDPKNPTISFTLVDNENLLTDDELEVVQNTSGVNTGDQDLSDYQTKEDNLLETDSNDIVGAINEVNSIAKGAGNGRVFNTVTDLDAWLAIPENIELLKIGDAFYIVELGIPDYWWDGTQKQELETQKVDLTEYYNKEETDNLLVLKQNANPGICEQCPILASDIVIDTDALTLTIATRGGNPISVSNPVRFFVDGDGTIEKFEKYVPQVFNFTNTTGVWYFHFDRTGTIVATQTAWTDFSIIASVYRFYWNATLSGANRLVSCALETHSNSISASDHAWKHRYGTIWLNGFDIVHNRIASGAPNADGRNTLIGLTTGNNIDDNLQYTVTNDATNALFNQDLGTITAANLAIASNNGAKLKIRTNDAGGLLQFISATQFPFPYSANNIPEYITSTGVRTEVSSGNFFVTYVYALQDPRFGEAIKVVSSNVQYNTLTLAQAANWNDLQALYPTLNDNEIRPLYKLIYEYRSSYDVAIKKAALRQVDDIRKTQVTSTTTASGTIPATNVTTLTGNAQTDITNLQMNNNAQTTVVLAAYDVDMQASSRDYSKTCGSNSQFTISNPIVGKTFRMFLTGGTLNSDLFNGYTETWLASTLLTDYIPANINVLYCELRSAGVLTLFWGE